MPGRRGGRRQYTRGARRRTSWVELINDTTTANFNGNTVHEEVLLLPATDADAVTLIRIVGSVCMLLQADFAGGCRELAWGIHWAPAGSIASARYSPQSPQDMEVEHWMHIRSFWDNTGFASQVPATLFDVQSVDIKVKRIVHEGDGIKLVARSNDAYIFAAKLRGLVLLT